MHNTTFNLTSYLIYYYIKYLDLIAKHFILIAITKVFYNFFFYVFI